MDDFDIDWNFHYWDLLSWYQYEEDLEDINNGTDTYGNECN